MRALCKPSVLSLLGFSLSEGNRRLAPVVMTATNVAPLLGTIGLQGAQACEETHAERERE